MWSKIAPLVDSISGLRCAKRAGRSQCTPDVEASASAFVEAVREGNAAGVAVMLQREEALVSSPGILHLAVNTANVDVLRLMLEHCVPLETTSSTGATALHVAAAHGETTMAQLLLDKSANANATTVKQQTPLMMAVGLGMEAAAALLLERRASLAQRSADGETVLSVAASRSSENMMKLLLLHGALSAEASGGGQPALTAAAEAGNATAVQLLLQSQADTEAQSTSEGTTALHVASKKGHSKVVSLLISNRASLNAVTASNCYTPLHYAAFTGSTEVAGALLEAAAAVDTLVGISGETALHLAAMHGHAGVSARLLQSGAMLEAENTSGLTPLLLAIMHDSAGNVAKLLLESSANVHAAWRLMSSTLHEAAMRGAENTVKLLLDRKADLNLPDAHGDRPLHCAASQGHVGTAKLLLDSGAAVDQLNDFGLTALHAGAFNDCLDVIKLLLEYRSAPASTDNFGDTPAQVAQSESAMRILLREQGLQGVELEAKLNECLEVLRDEMEHWHRQICTPAGLSASWGAAAQKTLTPLERQLLLHGDITGVKPAALVRELARARRSLTFDRRVRSMLCYGEEGLLKASQVLGSDACRRLCEEVDEKASLRGGRTDQMPEFTLHLSRVELEALIGTDLVHQLWKLARDYRRMAQLPGMDEDPKEMEIFLRKYSAGTRPWIKMHADIATVTANVALSDERGQSGGRLLGFIAGKIHPIERSAGDVTIHSSSLLHGVTRMQEGLRYTLIIFFQ